MNSIPFDNEQDPTRRAIIGAMNRLFAGTPQRSNGRLNVSQLAIEANVKRWHLTHQHADLRQLFQTKATELETKRTSNVHSSDAFEELEEEAQGAAGPLQDLGSASSALRDHLEPAVPGERCPLRPRR
ncbi:hypothetical protein [Streptomyces sp. NPDC020951]|uniref:hypothetical protein n=1 Tax=Streptomyces sp. NPDC020951 TaxID=3365104 RepID=UPI0037A182B7